jgi:membrane protein implicated in regulation of membrane protease activity
MNSWEDFYFVCFVVGFALSLLSALASAGHLHFPRGLHMHAGQAGGAQGMARGAGRGGRGSQGSYINFGTVTAFLAWFGGTGYLLTRYSSVWVLLALALAVISGLGGAAAVFWFLFKVLLAHEKDLDPADYDMIGMLGRVSSVVREGGVGEMIFSQEGSRRATPIRSETGAAIAKGTEVVVTRYEKGIAYVRPWEEINEEPVASS